jgi:hypothetical protein
LINSFFLKEFKRSCLAAAFNSYELRRSDLYLVKYFYV